MFCTHCGTEWELGGRFCINCGRPLIPPTEATAEDSPVEQSVQAVSSSVHRVRVPPSGVGGWLALLVFGLLFLGPLFGAGRISADFISAEGQYPAIKSHPQYANLKAATWSTFLAFAILSIYAGWGLAKGSDWSVVQRARIVLWVIGPVSSIVIGALVPFAVLRQSAVSDPQFIGSFIASVIVAAVWTSYLSNSKRVRATYGAMLVASQSNARR